MTTSEFLTLIEETASDIRSYRLGGSAADGTADCIGLIIGALRRGGISWPGIHGTNWTWRNAVKETGTVSDADTLEPGDLLFKARAPGDAKYDLPSRYASSPDQKDYYHVGVVTSVSPLRVTHCTSGGIRHDTKLGQWKYRAKLKYLQDTPAVTAVPRTDSGDDVIISMKDISAARSRVEQIRTHAEWLDTMLSDAQKG